MSETADIFPKRRRSTSADAALHAEMQRVEKLTIAERIRAALSMAGGFQSPPIPPKKQVNDTGQDG
jgi:hypothetical protein